MAERALSPASALGRSRDAGGAGATSDWFDAGTRPLIDHAPAAPAWSLGATGDRQGFARL